jgi:energy-coupling factor transporter ATP-binding protein EcfA2
MGKWVDRTLTVAELSAADVAEAQRAAEAERATARQKAAAAAAEIEKVVAAYAAVRNLAPQDHSDHPQRGTRLAVIGPMKSGKSTLVNTMVGISVRAASSTPYGFARLDNKPTAIWFGQQIAPKRSEAMTQIATVITNIDRASIEVVVNGKTRKLSDIAEGALDIVPFSHSSHISAPTKGHLRLPGSPEVRQMSMAEHLAYIDVIKNLSIPKLEFNVKPFRYACLIVHEICKMSKQNKQEAVDQIISHMASAVKQVYKQIATQGRDAPWWNQLITCRDDKLVITAEGRDDAEEQIRVWLTRLNDICRIASNFCFTATGTLSEFACIGQSIPGLVDQPSPLNYAVEQMFADENLPEVMVSRVSTGL